VDEFRIGPGETYDVLVEPGDGGAYTIFAEALDRSGFARGTLVASEGLAAPIPAARTRPVRTMADMGMGDMEMHAGQGEGGHGVERVPPGHSPAGGHGTDGGRATGSPAAHDHMGRETAHAGLAAATANEHAGQTADPPGVGPVAHGPDDHGPGNAAVAEVSRSRLHEPGLGLGDAGRRVLVYTDLKSLAPGPDSRIPAREIELHVTGNMERYMWSFDGKKYSEAKTPIRFQHGERLRLTMVNDTMMEHPLHLHGMWMELENGAGAYKPRKHTVVIKPAERLSVAITADAPGAWAFHCHLLLHMEMGMFRVVEVVGDTAAGAA
jgi:CopA family copper-resistance protein